MAEDLLFYSRDQVIEMLDYLARGMTGYVIPAGTSPTSPAGENDKPTPADEIMAEFVYRVRRMKSFCEVDGLWPPRQAQDDRMLPRLELSKAEPATTADTPGAVPLDEMQMLTRTLRYMLGVSEQPAAGQPVVLQLEGLLPRAIQLGDGWRLVERGRLRALRGSSRRCGGGGVACEALLRLFGKLNAWDIEDLAHLNRTMADPHRTKRMYAQGLSRQTLGGGDLFRYHRSDPHRPMRPDKYGDWPIVGGGITDFY